MYYVFIFLIKLYNSFLQVTNQIWLSLLDTEVPNTEEMTIMYISLNIPYNTGDAKRQSTRNSHNNIKHVCSLYTSHNGRAEGI